MTGPGPTRDSDVAKLLTEASGKEIKHIELGFHKYAAAVKQRGLPDWVVKDSAQFEKMKAFGLDERPSAYTKDLESIIGRKPETFKEYLDNKSSMRPGLKFP